MYTLDSPNMMFIFTHLFYPWSHASPFYLVVLVQILFHALILNKPVQHLLYSTVSYSKHVAKVC